MNTIVSTHLVLASAEMTPRLFDLDFQLLHDAVLSIIAVFALFLIASHLLFNPVRDMLRKRQEKIKGELDSAAKDMAEAKDLKAEYESRLKDIDKEAENILSEARKKARLWQRQRKKRPESLKERMWKPNWRRRKRLTK